jgi:SAM-dependent methyltransferase
MTDPIEINRRTWDERAIIHARDTTGFYGLDRARSNEDGLHSIEATELGDISQKRVLHLQCHIGTDTLRLVRLGAIVTGLDFAAEPIRAARRLADEAGLKADFVEGRVDEAPRLVPGPFDLVYVTWGTICWLPDLAIGHMQLRPSFGRAANSISRTPTRASRLWRNAAASSSRPTILKRRPIARSRSRTRRPTRAIPL